MEHKSAGVTPEGRRPACGRLNRRRIGGEGDYFVVCAAGDGDSVSVICERAGDSNLSQYFAESMRASRKPSGEKVKGCELDAVILQPNTNCILTSDPASMDITGVEAPLRWLPIMRVFSANG